MLDVAPSINKLSIADRKGAVIPETHKQSKEAVADSWEDDLSSGEDDIAAGPDKAADYPIAPPPTPASGRAAVHYEIGDLNPTERLEAQSFPRPRSEARPDKTDAAAKRMIAGALGIRAPRKTEEQKEYEEALKRKEARRRDEARQAKKAAEEAEQQAKAAIWSDQ